MARKKVVIIGGGIAGLSAAYALGKEGEVTLLEKSARVGGWIDTLEQAPFFFERGPRIFPVRRGQQLLKLAFELGLGDQLVPTASPATRRYLAYRGKLHPVPTNPLALITSPLTKGLLPRLLFKEWRIPPEMGDETLYQFAKRRLGVRSAELLFDPLAKGIFGGDARELSVEAVFPLLKRLERTSGSLVKGALLYKRKSISLPAALKKAPYFAFRQGTKALLLALAEQIQGELALNEAALAVAPCAGGWEVHTTRRTLVADSLVMALPAFEAAALLSSVDAALAEDLLSIPYRGLTLVHIAFASDELPVEGFGYLIPNCEKEPAYGVLFDSSLFPHHNRREKETRLTVLFKEGEAEAEKKALQTLAKHLKIVKRPDFIAVSTAPRAIPQYNLGYLAAKERILKESHQRWGDGLRWTGSAFGGVSVHQCLFSCN